MKRAMALSLISALALLVVVGSSSSEAADREEHALRRARLMEQCPDGAVVLLGATTLHSDHRFFQSHEFYYFTGVEAPNAALIIDSVSRESTLFLSLTEDGARGEGLPLGLVHDPGSFTGVERVLPSDQFTAFLSELVQRQPVIYTPFKPEELQRENSGEKLRAIQRAVTENPWDGRLTRELQFVERLEQEYPQAAIRDCSPAIWDLRKYKSRSEVDLIRKAAQLAVQGHLALIDATQPGATERELGALFEYVCKRAGASDLAYNVIIMSGLNHAYGHYHIHDRTLADGEFVILDAGPDFEYYNADVSTTFPVSGRFSPRQREIYEMAYGIYQVCLQNYRPGVTLRQVGEKVREHLIATGHDPDDRKLRGLVRWGGWNHSIGMATHDVQATFNGPDEVLKPGYVFACDINIPYAEEKMGIRIEDTVVITETGHENLSAGLPRSIEEIEAFMRKR